ncbi:MAG: hypothetical protein WCK47_12560 [bacterium]
MTSFTRLAVVAGAAVICLGSPVAARASETETNIFVLDTTITTIRDWQDYAARWSKTAAKVICDSKNYGKAC